MRLCLSCFLIIVPVEAGTPELSTGIGGVPAASGYIVTDVLFGQYRMVLRDLLGRRCGFEPSCSVYGQEAIALHGPVLGVMVALERWTRCNSSALKADYYERTGDGLLRLDPLDTGRGDVKWDSLLLPF
ncbi:MAG: hypothetical protein AVO35_05835 [Candidatus Aegiribacteria sp. MLS_C]|nr:MAG: hypothetical protein AVO35_05835 [Candidatus Aegiribacteria sp. MLS_C]